MKKLSLIIATLLVLSSQSYAEYKYNPHTGQMDYYKNYDATLAEVATSGGVSNDAYNAVTWNNITATAPSKDAVRDKFESLSTVYQPLDSDLTTWAGVTSSANGRSLVSAADYSAMRTLLGLVVDTNVQAYDADLTTYAGITPSANIQSFLGSANYSDARTNLGVAIGSNVQAYDYDLGALSSGITGIVKGAGDTGGYAAAVAGTDYVSPDVDLTSLAGGLTGIIKGGGNGNGYSAASAGTDYLAPAAIGSTVQAYDADLSTLAAISGVRGDIIYYGASGWTRLAKGTENYYLKQGANDPAWAVGGAGGASAFDDLTDVTITSAAAGDVLYYNGSAWINLAKDAGKYLKSGASAVSWDTPAGAGDMLAASYPHIVAIEALAVSDSNIIVGNGSTWVAESGSTARTSLGLAIGTNVQAYDADLTTYAGITPSANIQTFLGSSNYSDARTNLGVAIGTNVQAYDADLTTYAGITPSANIQTFLGSADYSAARTNLGLAIGTNVQAYDADLASIAGGVTGLVLGAGNGGGFSAAVAGTDYPGLASSNTFTGNNSFGDANTDTLTIRSLLIGGNSRAVWIAGSAPSPTYATGTNELYVGGDVEAGGTVYSGGYASLTTNTSWSGGNLGGTGIAPTVTGLTIASQAQGDVLYYNGSAWVRLAAGTNGQYLKTFGAGANPSWSSVTATPGGDGSPSGQIQYESSGSLAAEDEFYYTAASNLLNVGNIAFTGYVASGADPADAGAIRLSNADYIYAEAAPAGTDISVLGVDSSEVIQIGASGASGVTITPNTVITGTLSAGAAGFTVDADGDVVGKSFTSSKVSGTAGTLRAYEANSTDTSTVGWMGPASISASWDYQFSSTQPSAGSIMVFGAPSSNISAQTWITLDDTGTNGDTTKIWSADKCFDQDALRLALTGGTLSGGLTLDDGTGASPSLTLTDGTDETAVFSKVDAGYLTLTTVAGDGFGILVGNLTVGNGTPGQTLNGEDAYVEGLMEVDGMLYADGGITTGAIVYTSLTPSAGVSDPYNPFYDSDAPGSTLAEKNMAEVHGAYVSGADNAEYGSLSFKVMVNGSMTTMASLDSVDLNLIGGLSFGAGTAVTSIDTDLSSVSSNDDTLASAKATKAYADTKASKYKYINLVAPHLCGAGLSSNVDGECTNETYGQAKFSATADKATNYVAYRIIIPPDMDTAQDITLESFAVIYDDAGTNANTERYIISMEVIGTGEDFTGTLAREVNIDITESTGDAAGDLKLFTTQTTLTSWRTDLSGNEGKIWLIRVARDADDGTYDTSTAETFTSNICLRYVAD